MFFSRVRKTILPIRSQREFCAKIPTFHGHLHLAAPLRRHFSHKLNLKTCRKFEGKTFVFFTVDEENRNGLAKQQNNSRRGKLMFKLMFKPAILNKLKFIQLIFNCAFRKDHHYIFSNSWFY